jgi:hypothetical protein
MITGLALPFLCMDVEILVTCDGTIGRLIPAKRLNSLDESLPAHFKSLSNCLIVVLFILFGFVLHRTLLFFPASLLRNIVNNKNVTYW